MKKKIYSRLSFLSIAAALLSSVLIFGIMQINATLQMKRAVQESAALLCEVLNHAETDVTSLEKRANFSFRLTLIDKQGTVLFDNANAAENHADRPEIKAALLSGAGEATRLSRTLQKQTYYYAVRLINGNVLRVSSTTASVYAQVVSCIPYFAAIVLLVAFLSMLVGNALTKRLLSPIAEIDVEHPLKNSVYEEFTPLLMRIDKQNKQLSSHMKTLEEMKNDLADIMESMSEGLIGLSDNGTVLSINRSALKFFACEKEICLGQSILCVNRSAEFLNIDSAVKKGENLQQVLQHGGRTYHASLSQAERGGSILLIIDVTDKFAAEKMRREFSANVSHELKTPLQSISGYAELLQNNMVKDEDKPHFYENIYNESRRLITLVQDIIDLSQLDEGEIDAEREAVNLYELCQNVKNQLSEKAKKRQVKLTVEGSDVFINGIRNILQEMVYNLCDNAITYNKTGGSVTISIKKQGENAVLCVSDTGIGIPPKHHQRVFERFYRVDKSHSKQTGGTGLGLSIVKHAAAIHGGEITLNSSENVGTDITVRF